MSDIQEVKKAKDEDFLKGTEKAVESTKIEPGENVLVIGGDSYKHFLKSLHHYSKKKGANSRINIEEKIEPESKEQQEMLDIIEEHEPDVVFMSFNLKDWPGRMPIYKKIHEANPDAYIVTMPEMTENAVKNILATDPEKLREKTRELKEKLEGKRGKEFTITTEDNEGEKHELKGFVPEKEKHEEFEREKYPVPADDQTRKEGELENLPGGEAFFQPMELNGRIVLNKKSVLGDLGSVDDYIELEINDNQVTSIKGSEEDEELVEKAEETLSKKNCDIVSELGLGTHPKIDLDDAEESNLLAEKVGGTFHLGFGDNSGSAGWGDVEADDHFDFIVSEGNVSVENEEIV